ncbi:MAG: sigma-70 family RNA polymerase sigma factor [Planctomycetes bacterium]|nr:sigma-70 family RNA polymerase sigma factor [Planctomycetota bacterium]
MPEASRDAVTARLLVAGDAEGLRRLLQDHGGAVRAWVRRDSHRVLDEAEIDDVMGEMAVKVWQAGPRFDAAMGTLRAFCAVVARNCALRTLALRWQRATTADPDLDRHPLPDPSLRRPLEERQRLLADLRDCIAALPPLQRAIALADLDADGRAAAGPLAERLGTTANSIYSSRQKARCSLREAMEERGHRFDREQHGVARPEGA